MPLAFSNISVLLSRLEAVENHDPPFLPKDKATQLRYVTESWFNAHRRHINELDVEGATALLSSLLPERRTDRVYGIQALSLCRILGRGLSLSAARIKDLQAYKESRHGDLAQCLERVLMAGGPPAIPAVSLNEVDDMLHVLAGQCRFSDPRVTSKLPPGSSEVRDNVISNIFKRVSPQEGKWLVRLILKDLSPVKINESLVLKSFHIFLPDLLRFQNTFASAVHLLKSQLREYPERPDPRSERLLRLGAALLLRPEVGVKIGRPDFHKARSIEHYMNMLGGRRWVLERKYDGEYCEIHIDLRKSPKLAECIQIFSKSGKDSTCDRRGIHETLIRCLRLGRPDCKIEKQAILLAELVVYSDDEGCIAPFDAIRRHVTRSGVLLGTDADSFPHACEHLAVVFFDLLLLDEEVVMRKPVEERRNWLREVYHKIPGRAMGAEWKIVDFSESGVAKKRLMDQFAASIARRCEGLILKPCGLPYFPLGDHPGDGVQGYIKLKKDYIDSMGDEADLAVIGASYNAQQAARCNVKGIRWTDFHLGCVLNATDVHRFNARPTFTVVGTIQSEACIPKPILLDLNKLGAVMASTYKTGTRPPNFDLRESNVKMDVTFDDPFVLEVLGSGFTKPSNCSFYMLRHARVKKLHRDRTWKDCISFQELQEQASAARTAPIDSESQETRRWLAKLEKGHKRKFERSLTPKSKSTVTPSTKGKTTLMSPTLANLTVRSEMDGSTLVSAVTASRERARDVHKQTPCPPTKKQRHQGQGVERLDSHTNISLKKSGISQPLTDITNQATRPAVPACNLSASSPRSSGLASANRERPISPSSEVCPGSRCLFANSVLFLSSCISATPYVTDDLACAHETLIVPDIRQWDRDAFVHPPMTAVVSESQSHADRRKIVLVERKRTQAVRNIVQQITGLNGGRLRERVEVYDWRVLEECSGHDFGAEALKRYFIGATVFDEAQESSRFVSMMP